jgi:hypothetical protein
MNPMPFNDKGEFIRRSDGQARSAQQRAKVRTLARSQNRSLSEEDFWILLKGLAGLALLASAIWVVLIFGEWIAIGAALWLVSYLRSWLR